MMTCYFPGKVWDRPTAEICSLRSQTALSILPPAARPAKGTAPTRVLPCAPLLSRALSWRPAPCSPPLRSPELEAWLFTVSSPSAEHAFPKL